MSGALGALRWERDGADWPNRAASRFVTASGFRWHVQIMGAGPQMLLIHGTGASTHSWRDVLPRLADRFTVVAPDLPGHGFTDTPPAFRLSLPGMSRALADLLRALDVTPVFAAGHSAGAPILARMCLDGHIAPRGLASFNGAFLPPRGVPGRLFSPVAKLLVGLPQVPRLFARRAARAGTIERLLRETGSHLDARGTALYVRLGQSAAHVGGALAMMANWDLRPLMADLPRLAVPLTLIVAANDRTIPPRDADLIRARLPSLRLISQPGLGHLAHEERPDEAADLLARLAAEAHAPA